MKFSAFGQKDISRSYDSGDIEHLEIIADEVYKIRIETSEENHIVLTTHSEGEYFNDINLDVERFQDKMIITSGFPEILQSGYDKLSVHKVFSLEMILKIPKGLNIYIRSNIAGVMATGVYKNLKMDLQAGSCILKDFTGNAVVNTYRGSIYVETKNAVVTAHSGNGKVEIPADLQGLYTLKLRSINGDIKVLKN